MTGWCYYFLVLLCCWTPLPHRLSFAFQSQHYHHQQQKHKWYGDDITRKNGKHISNPNRFLTSSSKNDENEFSPSSRHSLKYLSSYQANLEYLQDRFDLDESWVEKLRNVRKPVVPANKTVLIERLENLQHSLHLSKKDVGRIVRGFPSVLLLRVDTIQAKLNFLLPTVALNDTKVLSKMFVSHPYLLALSVDENLEPTMNSLQQRLDMNGTEISQMIRNSPTILSLNFTTGLEPKLDWLQDRLQLDDSQMKKLLRKQPGILNLKMEDTIQVKLAWVQERLSIDEKELKKLVLRHPFVLIASPEKKLEPTLQWLEEKLNTNTNGVSRIVCCQPSLLDMNISTNLQPTYDFFTMCLGGDEERVANLLKCYPRCLLSSLEKRLKPRWEQIKQYEADGLIIEIDAACVRRMAMNTDDKWQTSLNYQSSKVLSRQQQ